MSSIYQGKHCLDCLMNVYDLLCILGQTRTHTHIHAHSVKHALFLSHWSLFSLPFWRFWLGIAMRYWASGRMKEAHSSPAFKYQFTHPHMRARTHTRAHTHTHTFSLAKELHALQMN